MDPSYSIWICKALPTENHPAPDGNYNIERMLKRVAMAKSRVLLCGTCMDARGMTAEDMMEGAHRSTMDELAATTVSAHKVLVF